MKPFEGTRVVLWAGWPEALATVGETLSKLGCRVQSVDSLEQVRRAMEGNRPGLIVAQLCYCFRQPLELLRRLRPAESPPPVLVVSPGSDVDLYIEAMRLGAFDCVGHPVDQRELIRIVSQALETQLKEAAKGVGR